MLYQKLVGLRPESPSISARPSIEEDDAADVMLDNLSLQGSGASRLIDAGAEDVGFDPIDTQDLVPAHITLDDSWASPLDD